MNIKLKENITQRFRRSRSRLILLLFAAIFMPLWFAIIVIGYLDVFKVIDKNYIFAGIPLHGWLWISSILLPLSITALVFLIIVYTRATAGINVLIQFARDIESKDFKLAINKLLDEVAIEEQTAYLAQILNRIKNSFAKFQMDLVQKTKESARLKDELMVAQGLQRSMLPREFSEIIPQEKNIDLYADLLPATEVGGDFYDSFLINNNKLFLVIGDVCGKGIPACVLMARMVTLVRALAASESPKYADQKLLPALLTRLNESFYHVETEQRTFVSMIIATLNLTTGKLIYCNAGHNPICLLKGQALRFLESSSKPIGLRATAEYKTRERILKPNDIVFFYTDGIVEAHNKAGDIFDYDKLKIALLGRAGFDAHETIGAIFNDVINFSAERSPEDDVTALLIRWQPQKFIQKPAPIIKSLKSQQTIYESKISEVSLAQIDVKSFLIANNIPKKYLFDIEVCVEEISSNIIKHGYGTTSTGEITIKVDISAHQVAITFIDSALAFNPCNLLSQELPVDHRRIAGGHGLHLIAKLADEQYYARKNKENRLTLIKNIVS